MKFRHFERGDFDDYLSWYQDRELNRQLGPMDVEWLDCVLERTPPLQYSFFHDGELVVVIGVEEPEPGSGTWYITDVATKPGQKRRGFSRDALKSLIAHFSSLKEAPARWVAWVDASNVAARGLFESMGWEASRRPNSENLFELSFEVVE